MRAEETGARGAGVFRRRVLCVAIALAVAAPGLAQESELEVTPPEAAGEETIEDTGEERPGIERLPETVVEAPRPLTAASSEEVRRRDLELRPLLRPADILEVTPGLIVVQHAGGGKANQYFLRGFDNDHGTDLALSVDGVPVNMVSHGHGQGYADLHYLIPELVEVEQVHKGPYFLEFGDLANSGAINLVLRRKLGERSVAFQGGQFGVRRSLVMADLPTKAVDSWIAGETYTQDGPFESPEDLFRYNLVARAVRPIEMGEITFTATSYAARWNASGQIPLRAVEAGIVDRFGSIDPTEGGETSRHQFYLQSALRPTPRWDVRTLAYAVLYDFTLFSNFTFFLDHPRRGDQIRQTDDRFLGGTWIDATHRSEWGSVGLATRLGFQLRADTMENELANTRQRVQFATTAHDDIHQFNFAFYVGEDVVWTDWLRTMVGVRVDHLDFNVTNRLDDPNSPNASAGHESATLASPKATVVLTPRTDWDVFLNFGRGYHSNDARGVTRFDDPADPTAASTGAEIGTRTRLFDRLDLASAYFLLDLQSELVFVGDTGGTEPSSRTRRHGFEVETRYRITDWLWADADYTNVTARFRDEPSGDDDVPLAPRYTVTGGLTARHPWGVFASFRNRTISDRPANESDTLTAEGYSVFDLEAGWSFPLRFLSAGEPAVMTLSVDVLNLFDDDYREAQFDTTSCLESELGRVPACTGPVRTGISDIDFTPGWPRTVIAGIKVTF